MPAGRLGQHLLGHGLMFAAAAGVGGDPLCSAIREWIAAPVIGPGLFLPACRRLRAGGRIDTLRTVRGFLPGMRFRPAITRRNALPAGQSLPCPGEDVTAGLPNARMAPRA